MKTWLVIDVYNLLYRSFYAVKPLYTSKKIPIQAVFGFLKTFLKAINTYNPDYVVACIDTSTKDLYRTKIYPEYKANRFQAPLELDTQKELIAYILKGISINIFQEKGFEADDGIAYYANYIQQKGDSGIILTADKDLHYLISDSVHIYDPMKGLLLDKSWVQKTYGQDMTKEKFLLYFSLVGDTADNIAGVKGIGPKTVQEFLDRYDSLDDLYNRFEKDIDIKPRIKNLLIEQKESAYLAYTLCSPYLPKDLIEENKLLLWNQESIELMYPFFEEYEFTSLIPANYKKKEKEYEDVNLHFKTIIISEENEFDDLEIKIKDNQIIAFDCETKGEYKKNHEMIGFSLSFDESFAYYIPLESPHKNHNKERVFNLLKILCEDSQKTLIMHHAFFDLSIIIDIIPTIKCKIEDTLLAASLCCKAGEKKGLKDLSLSLFNEKMKNYDDVVDSKLYNSLADIKLEEVALYAAADARQTWKLYLYFKKKLEEFNLIELYNELEVHLIPILLSMYKEGIYVKQEVIYKCRDVIQKLLIEIQEEIELKLDMLPGTLNLRSHKQVRDIIVEKLRIPLFQKTKTSKEFSTDQESLEKIKDKNPLISKIIAYRMHSSIESRCVDGFLESINIKTNSVHPSYNYYSIVTGRITTYDPNLQNIPQEYLNLPYSIREAFEAKPGNLFISLDYSQIELRVLAHLSNDDHLIRLFLNNDDIHLQTAKMLYQKENISDQERQAAKILNFSIVYGASAKNISEQMFCSLDDAKDYMNKHKKMYPGIYEWMDNVIKNAKDVGFVKTALGRRRYIPELQEKNALKYNEGKRLAVNTIIQGSAAEILKKALINVFNFLKKEYPLVKVVLQIHDELILEGPSEQIIIIAPMVQKIMENVFNFSILLKVNYKIGINFKEIS